MSVILGVYDSSDQQREVSDNNGYPVKLLGASGASIYSADDGSTSLATTQGLRVISSRYGWGGSAWERVNNNTQGTLLASAARTASVASPTQTNYNARGVLVTLRVTAASGTGGLQLVIVGYDNTSAAEYWLTATPTAITTATVATYELYPGANGAAANDVKQRTAGSLPRSWYIRVQHGDASSYTYSVGYSLIV